MIPLANAQHIAKAIINQLAEFCEKIEVAGSIRRKRAFCGDVDIVAMARVGQEEKLRERCRRKAEIAQEGPQILRMRLPDKHNTQVEIFFAQPETRELFQVTPTNWGSVMLCRTGSKEHNIYLCERAIALRMEWRTTTGIYTNAGLWIAGQTEEEIFRTLKLDYVEPERRER